MDGGVLVIKFVSPCLGVQDVVFYDTEDEILDHLHLLTVSLNYGLMTFCPKRAICLGDVATNRCSHCSMEMDVHVHFGIDKFICTGCYHVFPMMILCEAHVGLCKLKLLAEK